MDEFIRAVEATLFASATPLSVEEIAEHVGEGPSRNGAGPARRAL